MLKYDIYIPSKLLKEVVVAFFFDDHGWEKVDNCSLSSMYRKPLTIKIYIIIIFAY